MKPFAASVWAAALGLILSGPAAAHGDENHDASVAPVDPAAAGDPVPLDFGGPFALTDHSGRRVSEQDFRGRHLLLVFGYARCERVCPLALDRMAAALDALGPDAARIAPVLVTVDPEDDPATLARRLAKVDPRLIGLTGSERELDAAARAFQLDRGKVGQTMDGTPVYRHGSYIYFMDEQGVPLSILPPVLPAQAMADILRRHLEAADRPGADGAS